MNHRNLHCYQRLLHLIKTLQTLMPTWPTGLAFLGDQIKRAQSSALLNLVEGNSRTTVKDRRVFFVRAAASLAELDAALELLAVYHPRVATALQPLHEEMRIIYAMIWKMH